MSFSHFCLIAFGRDEGLRCGLLRYPSKMPQCHRALAFRSRRPNSILVDLAVVNDTFRKVSANGADTAAVFDSPGFRHWLA